jgi:hypothetical protein
VVALASCRLATPSTSDSREGPTEVRAVETSTSARDRSAEVEASWSRRDDVRALRSAISAWEATAAEDGSQPATWVRLARAYYFLGDAHYALLGEEREDDELAAYEAGVAAAERALAAIEPSFRAALEAGGAVDDVMRKLGKESVPAAFWYSANLARVSASGGLSIRLANKDRIRLAMERLIEIDRPYFYFGADRVLGAHWASLPTIIGKDMERAEMHFRSAREGAPSYLPTRVWEAQMIALERGDRALYQSLLEEVLAAPEGDNRDIAPENRAAKRRAKKMLAEIGQKFWLRSAAEGREK